MPACDPLLLGVALAHGLVALACLGLLRVRARPLLGVHPASKPLKFAVSIAAFLGTLAVLVPALTLGAGMRQVLAGALALSLVVEMTIIGAQALRGRRSHFHRERPLDAALTSAMLGGIAVLVVAMAAITIIATVRPVALPALVTAAFRAGLWFFPLAAITGLGMGGRGGHTIGGADGGPGMRITNWSTVHGDLRVSHFVSLHALQLLPLLAVVLAWLPLGDAARWTLLGLGTGATAGLAGWTWRRALAGRPLLVARTGAAR